MHTSLCSWTTCLVHTGKVRIKMSIRFVDVSFFLYTIYILQSTFLFFMSTFRLRSFFFCTPFISCNRHFYLLCLRFVDVYFFLYTIYILQSTFLSFMYTFRRCSFFSVHHLYPAIDIFIFYVYVSLTYIFFCKLFISCSRHYYLLCQRFVEVSLFLYTIYILQSTFLSLCLLSVDVPFFLSTIYILQSTFVSFMSTFR